jgi:hypothetical protein
VGIIDRIRYYDGEFLRAFDFSDEQTYHMEMRRRLNRYLHLYGIVQGLDLVSDTEAGFTQVYIERGLAIDAFGREIYVFAPHTLGNADITANKLGSAVDHYDVWLRYQKTASTPPSAGYGNCNQANQYTRWQESFSVVLLKHPSPPMKPPRFSLDDTDDPSQDDIGVLLGTVTVDPGSATQFSNPKTQHRHYVGVITQRIRTPAPYDAQAISAFNFPSKQSPLNPPVSLEIEPNIFAKQNLILGPDFDLTKTPNTATPSNAPIDATPGFSSGLGNAKIAGDLIVKGNIYSYSATPDTAGNPQWLGLSAYVQQLVQQGLPDIAIGTGQVSPASSPPPYGNFAAGGFSGTASVSVTMNRLTAFSSQQVIAYFSQIETTDQTDFNTLFGTGQVQLMIVGQPKFAFSGASTSGNVSVSWQAQPGVGGTPGKCAIDNFTLTCLVILFP